MTQFKKYPKDFPEILQKDYQYISIPYHAHWKIKSCQIYLKPRDFAVPRKILPGDLIATSGGELCCIYSDLLQYCSKLLKEPFNPTKHVIKLETGFDNYGLVFIVVSVHARKGRLNLYYKEELKKYNELVKEYKKEAKDIHKIKRAWSNWKRSKQAELEEKEYQQIKIRLKVLEKKRNKQT